MPTWLSDKIITSEIGFPKCEETICLHFVPPTNLHVKINPTHGSARIWHMDNGYLAVSYYSRFSDPFGLTYLVSGSLVILGLFVVRIPLSQALFWLDLVIFKCSQYISSAKQYVGLSNKPIEVVTSTY